MSYFVNYYDTLFGDVVATGERARAANTYSAVDLEGGEEVTDFGDDDGNEGSGDSDDNNFQSPPSQNLFPSTSFKSGSSSVSKRKKSRAELVGEKLDGLVVAMSCRSTTATAASEDPTLNEAIILIDSMPQFCPVSDLYFFAQQYILHPGNRTLFLKARNNELRYGQILYNFKYFKGPGSSSDGQ